MEAVDICPTCDLPVSPNDVVRVQKVEDMGARFLIYQHSACNQVNQRYMPEGTYQQFVKRWKNYERQGKTQIDKLYDPEEVGKLVQGFRIDLDAVETLDDILLYWDSQQPWEVPIEKVR